MTKLSVALLHALGAGVAVSVVATASHAQQAQKIDKIEVTGSNIKRIEGESALPVTVISRDDIQKSGVTTAAELMDRISAASGGGFSMAQGVGDANGGRATVSLRGLGDTNTLILLNGRRLSTWALVNGGGGVDLNQIPLAAVERVEVLKDGASAIYGTDAIGGVINFILRKDFTGLEASAYATHTQHDGGNVRRYTATLGYGDLNKQRFNILASFDYEKDDALLASQRLGFTGTGIRPDMGFTSISSRSWPANFTFNGTSYNVSAATGCMPAQGSYRVNGDGTPSATNLNCVQDFSAVLDIFPKVERKGFYTRGAFQIANDHQVFLEYNLQKNEATFGISETPAVSSGGPFLGVPVTYPAGGRYYPTSFVATNGQTITPTGDLAVNWRLKSAGRRTDLVESKQDRLVGGFQGVIAGWDYTAGLMEARSRVSDSFVDGHVSDARFRAAMATGNIDVFSGRPLDATGQALVDATKILEKVRDSETKVTSVDGRVSKEIMQLRNGPVGLALGFDARKEKLDDRPSDILFSGDELGGSGGLPPQSADRKVSALFGELSIPILRSLEAQLAVRTDHYSDFGNTTNPKVALRWTPTKEWLLRGSYSTGFRAPTLSDLFLPTYIGNTSGSHDDPARCPNGVPIGPFVDTPNECNIQFNSQQGGTPNLKPEKSHQWTMGAIFEPSADVSFGTEFWTVRRRDSIQALGDGAVFDTYGAADPVNAGGYFLRYARVAGGGCFTDIPGSPATPANVPCAIFAVILTQQNLGNYNVSGQDVTITARTPASSAGRFTFRLEGTYIYAYRYQEAKEAPYLENVGLYTTTNGAIPRWKHYATINWRSGEWGATLAQNFTLGYHDDTALGNPPRRVASAETWDFQVSWDAWKGISLVGGVRNLFDRNPPASAKSGGFVNGYDEKYTDPRLRLYYATLKYSFR